MLGLIFFTIIFIIAVVSKIKMDIDDFHIQRDFKDNPTVQQLGARVTREGLVDNFTGHSIMTYHDNGRWMKKDIKTGKVVDMTSLVGCVKSLNKCNEAIEKAKSDPDFKGKYVKFDTWYKRTTPIIGITGDVYVDIDNPIKRYVRRDFRLNLTVDYDSKKKQWYGTRDFFVGMEYLYKKHSIGNIEEYIEEEIQFSCLMDIDNAMLIGLTDECKEEIYSNWKLEEKPERREEIIKILNDFINFFNEAQKNGGFYKEEIEREDDLQYMHSTDKEKMYCTTRWHCRAERYK